MRKWVKIERENSDGVTGLDVELFKLNNHRILFMFFVEWEKNGRNRWFELGVDFFEWTFNIGVIIGHLTLNIGINSVDPISLNDEILGE